jgi:hypothetical protein
VLFIRFSASAAPTSTSDYSRRTLGELTASNKVQSTEERSAYLSFLGNQLVTKSIPFLFIKEVKVGDGKSKNGAEDIKKKNKWSQNKNLRKIVQL